MNSEEKDAMILHCRAEIVRIFVSGARDLPDDVLIAKAAAVEAECTRCADRWFRMMVEGECVFPDPIVVKPPCEYDE